MARKAKPAPESKTPKPTGRPRIEINKELLRAMAAIGATEEEIVAGLIEAGTQLDLRTLKRRLQEPEYRDIWETGKNKFKLSLRRLQYRHAQMSNSAGVNMLIHMSKHHLGETDKSLLELTGKDGGPVETRDVSAREVVESRIAGIAARTRTEEDTRKLN